MPFAVIEVLIGVIVSGLRVTFRGHSNILR